jgi:hypothetical protein
MVIATHVCTCICSCISYGPNCYSIFLLKLQGLYIYHTLSHASIRIGLLSQKVHLQIKFTYKLSSPDLQVPSST